MTNPVVTVTPTIMDGTVVRWYASEEQALNRLDPIVSASRNGVRVNAYLHEAVRWIDAATAAYEALKADRDADMAHLATHRRPFLADTLEPIGDRL